MDRCNALKFIATSLAVSSAACTNTIKTTANDSNKNIQSLMHDKWENTNNRTWLAGEYWANPMGDWHLVNGVAECKSIDGNRSIHSLTHRLENTAKSFHVSASVQAVGGMKYTDGGWI